jgi:hypothetical protein
MNIWAGFAWRLVRGAVGIGLASAVAYAANDPKWIWLAPVISAVAKSLRDKGFLKNLPV